MLLTQQKMKVTLCLTLHMHVVQSTSAYLVIFSFYMTTTAKFLHECFAHTSMLLQSVERCRSTSGLPLPPAVIATLVTYMSAPKTI